MLYAILGDIHSNLDALETVLEEVKKERPDQILSVGDIVGYAAQPSECIALIREATTTIVAGNHDYAAVGKMDISYFNPEAREAVIWTAQHLSQEEKDFLASLPLVIEKDNLTLVHGTLHRPELFNYIFTFDDAELCLRHLKGGICFVGHSHVPVAILSNDELQANQEQEVSLEGIKKAIINVGSVGQPRDRNPRACYILYDSEKGIVRFRRIEYDISSASKKILEAGLPHRNAERLRLGV